MSIDIPPPLCSKCGTLMCRSCPGFRCAYCGATAKDPVKLLRSKLESAKDDRNPPPGHVRLPDGRDVRVLGELPMTADGCVLGNGTFWRLVKCRNQIRNSGCVRVSQRTNRTEWMKKHAFGSLDMAHDAKDRINKQAAETARGKK